MRILITGVAGFVAGHFIEYIKQKNIDFEVFGVDIVDNFFVENLNFKYQKIDLKDVSTVKSVLFSFKPDYILHLASNSSVSQSWKQPAESFVNNTNIFLNMVESLKELNLKTRILSIGSSEEYGNKTPDKMPLNEASNLEPCNPYAVARVSQEMLSKIYAKYYNVDIIMTRSFNHIGPGQKDIFVIPSFVKQLCEIKRKEKNCIEVGNLEIVRDFLDVRDVVRAYWLLLLNGKSGEIYNVCSGQGIKLKQIIEMLSEELDIKPVIKIDENRIRPDDNMVIIGDNTKLLRDIGWSRKYEIQDTLRDMIKEFL